MMVYDYAEPTSFFPVEGTTTLRSMADYVRYDGKPYYLPFETWFPTGPIYPPMPTMHTWFWHPWYRAQPPEIIAEAYRDCMRRNANLLLNLAPDNTGRIPTDQVEVFRRVAELIRS